MGRKCILILLDGLGDRSYPQFDHQTPLQAARTPILDRLAAEGASGLYHAGRQGEALPSENAHFAIFGYEQDLFPGRGPLEALGAGIELGRKEVAVLAHFASLETRDNHLVLRDGKLTPVAGEARQLASLAEEFTQAGIRIQFTLTHRLSGILTLQGDVTPFFTDTDPIQTGRLLMEPRPLAGYESHEATCRTANTLKAYLLALHRKLASHPINQSRCRSGMNPIDGLVTQRAGRLKTAQPFEKRYGLRGLSLASGLVYIGLSRYLGMDAIRVQDSRDPGRDLAERLLSAYEQREHYDFIHVHTKVPDEAAHTKDPEAKRRAIEALDRGLALALPTLTSDPELLLVVCADHSTPSSGELIHSGEPVPLLFRGPGIRRDAVTRFDEISAAAGALGGVRERELMLMVLNALDRIKLRGLMDMPEDQPYWPGRCTPFTL